MSYQIVTDSSCNLTEVLIDELELEILPLTFMVDGVQHQSYLKGETTDLKQFYTMMREGKVITTSLPNLSNSEKLLTDILKSCGIHGRRPSRVLCCKNEAGGRFFGRSCRVGTRK